MFPVPPLIPSSSDNSDAFFNGNVDIFNTLTVSTLNMFSLSQNSLNTISICTFNNLNTGTLNTNTLDFSNLTQNSLNTISVNTFTTITVNTLHTNFIQNLSRYNVTPFQYSTFSVTSLTLPGDYIWNTIYFSNTNSPTFIKLPSSSSITSANNSLETNPGYCTDFWIQSNSDTVTINENYPNVRFNGSISGTTLTLNAYTSIHFKIYSPAPGIYSIISLGKTTYN